MHTLRNVKLVYLDPDLDPDLDGTEYLPYPILSGTLPNARQNGMAHETPVLGTIFDEEGV